MTSVCIIDNYDSFVYNLVQTFGAFGAEITVIRNDQISAVELARMKPDRIVVSPGPCTPAQAGISIEVMRELPGAGIPTLGVCLGHQALGCAYGAQVDHVKPIHGKATTIEHDGKTIFRDLPPQFVVGRYHSLAISERSLPDELEVTARGGGVIMGVRHRSLPVEGVQFHPESVLTPEGPKLLENFFQDGCSVKS